MKGIGWIIGLIVGIAIPIVLIIVLPDYLWGNLIDNVWNEPWEEISQFWLGISEYRLFKNSLWPYYITAAVIGVGLLLLNHFKDLDSIWMKIVGWILTIPVASFVVVFLYIIIMVAALSIGTVLRLLVFIAIPIAYIGMLVFFFTQLIKKK